MRHPACIGSGPGGSGPISDHAAKHYACARVCLPGTFWTSVSALLVCQKLHLVELTEQGVGFTITVRHHAYIDCGPEFGLTAKHHACTMVIFILWGCTIAVRHPAYMECGPGGAQAPAVTMLHSTTQWFACHGRFRCRCHHFLSVISISCRIDRTRGRVHNRGEASRLHRLWP